MNPRASGDAYKFKVPDAGRYPVTAWCIVLTVITRLYSYARKA